MTAAMYMYIAIVLAYCVASLTTYPSVVSNESIIMFSYVMQWCMCMYDVCMQMKSLDTASYNFLYVFCGWP